MANSALLILAAGNSSRLGRSKQLLTTPQGNSLLEHTIHEAQASKAEEVYIILGAEYEKHARAIDHLREVTILRNQNWSKGMGSSLKVGLTHILDRQPDLQFLLVSVCDQPYLKVNHFNNLIEIYENQNRKIVASKYDANSIGVPVLFDASKFADLLEIEGSAGALNYVKEHLEDVSFSDFKEGKLDVDTEVDVLKHRLS